MAIRCINYGFLKPFGKNVVFLDQPQQNPEVKSETKVEDAKLKEFNDAVSAKLDTENRKIISILKSVVSSTGDKEMSASELDNLKKWLEEIDSLETDLQNKKIDKPAYDKAIAELTKDAWAENIKLPEDTIKRIELYKKQAGERLSFYEQMRVPYGMQYLRNADGQKIDAKTMSTEFGAGTKYTIDFGGRGTTADKTIRLDQMLPKNGATIALYDEKGKDLGDAQRGPDDGKFYYTSGEKKGQYAAVRHGYSFHISSVEIKIPNEPSKVEEAVTEENAVESKKDKADAKAATERMLSERKDAELMAFITISGDFDKNKKVAIPDSIKDLSDFQLANDLKYMNHGSQVLEALGQLNQFAGKKTPVELFEGIRKRKLDKGSISLDEISLAVRGDHAKDVYKEYTTSMTQVNILDLVNTGRSGGMSGEKLFKFVKVQLASDEEKIMLNSMSEYLVEPPKDQTQIRAGLEKLKTFMAASAKMIKEIPKLEPKKESAEYKEDMKIKDLDRVEKIAQFIFPNFASTGPEASRSFLQKVFGKGKGTLDMQTLYKKGMMGSDIEQVASGESAYVQLVASAIEFGAQGEPVVNQDKFVAKLNQLRSWGFQHVAESQKKDLVAQCEDPANKDYLSKPLRTESIFGTGEGITPLERDLITFGFRKSEDVQRVVDMYNLEHAKKLHPEIFKGLDPVRTPIMAAIIQANPVLSEADLRDTANTVEKHMLLMAGVKVESKTVDDQRHFTDEPGKTTTTSIDAAGVATSFDCAGGKATMGIDSNGNIGFALNFEQKLDQKGRVRFSEGAGISAGPEGAKGALAVSLTLSPDQYLEHNFYVGGAAGVDLSANPKIGLALALGYKLNLDGTLARIEGRYSKDPELDAKLKTELKDYEASLTAQGLPPELINALLIRTAGFVEQNRGNEAVKDMPKVALTNASVAITDKGFGVAIKVAFKGKDEIIYSIPPQANVDQYAEAKIRDELAKKVGGDLRTEVFVAGNMSITPDGYTTITESEHPKSDKLDAINQSLASQGLQLIPIETANGEHRLRLRVTRVDGNVDIFTDKDSGIETYPGAKGEVILNLEEADKISVRRIDAKSGLRDSGGVLNTEIFISNNIQRSNDVIRYNSPDMVHFEGDIVHGQTKGAVAIENRAGKSSTYESETAAKAEGVQINDLYADMEGIRASGKGMSEALRSQKYEKSLPQARKTALEGFADQVLVGKDAMKLYKQLSVSMNDTEIAKMISDTLPDQKFSNADMTYMRQALMMKSLAKAPHDKEFVEHIKDWNRKALESQLAKQGMDRVEAKSISTKMMDYYGKTLELWLETGMTEADFGKSKIPEGAIVQIQVGTQNIEGYRQAFYQPAGAPEMLGAVNLKDNESLIKDMDLTPKEARDFQEAMTNRLSPLSEKPAELMKSQLGLSILSASELIFGAEKCRKLTEIVKDPDLATKDGYKETYAEFSKMVHDLRSRQVITMENGMILGVNLTKEVGFIDACRNFTMVMNEKLSITVPKTMVINADVQKYIEGDRTANYNEVGVATFISTEEKVKPPHDIPPTPEEEEELEGDKTPGLNVAPDQIRPDEIRGAGDEGHGDEVPA